MKVQRLFNLGMVMVMLVTSFAISQPVAAEAPVKFTPRINQDAEAVPGEVVVEFNDSQGKNLVQKIEQAVDKANDAGGEVTRLSLDGSAVIQVAGDTTTAVADLNAQPDVAYAELNYIYSVPMAESTPTEYNAASDFMFNEVVPNENTNGMSLMAVPNATIQNMQAMGTLPSDPYLTEEDGWSSIGASIVWPNTTASANICEIDTGVDLKHPDFKYIKAGRTYYRVLAGYNFVDGNTDVTDKNGHGTHIAGIMVAVNNNKIGVSGVSTGNVVAVKALDPQGVGTNWDIAKAIKYCADRTDVRIINLSLGSSTDSVAIKKALLYATTPTTDPVPGQPGVKGKGKLVVAAAGNYTGAINDTPTKEVYPAAYAIDPAFPNNRIISVGATGRVVFGSTDYACGATFSKMGPWVTVAAPGFDIYSTTPYDYPFYQNYDGNINTRYDFMSGTSMAAAFVAAGAARRMGYKPAETSQQVGTDIVDPGSAGMLYDSMDGSCTDAPMQPLKRLNVAILLDRAAVRVRVFDASAGVPLNGATVLVNFLSDNISTNRSAVIAPQIDKPLPGEDPDPNRIFTDYISVVDILDVPTVSPKGAEVANYKILVNKAGYTVGNQNIFQQSNLAHLTPGKYNAFLNGAVPPLSKQFDVVLGWQKWPPHGSITKPATSLDDLDLYVWLPDDSLDTDPAQPASFVVGYDGNAFGFLEGDSYGAMTDFPFARLKREGGYISSDPLVETTSILQRVPRSGGTVVANAALPYYAGSYTIMATDYGQTIDDNGDGCGDNYGLNFKPVWTGTPGTGGPGVYDPTTDPDCATGTLGIPLLGAYFTPYVYVWKDGVVKNFQTSARAIPDPDYLPTYLPWDSEQNSSDPNNCNDHWWKAFAIYSTTTSKAPAYQSFGTATTPACDNGLPLNSGFIPYSGYIDSNTADRIFISSLTK